MGEDGIAGDELRHSIEKNMKIERVEVKKRSKK